MRATSEDCRARYRFDLPVSPDPTKDGRCSSCAFFWAKGRGGERREPGDCMLLVLSVANGFMSKCPAYIHESEFANSGWATDKRDRTDDLA